MYTPKNIRQTFEMSEETYGKMNYLKGLFGIIRLMDFLNFAISITKLIADGILSGKKFALYDPKTDSVEIIENDFFTKLENSRDQNNP